MKTASNDRYGPPSVIKITKKPKPIPSKNEVLIKIHYSSVNRTDCGFLRADPFITRLFSGITKPRFTSLGCDFSGVVEQTGQDVKYFSKGDRVFGFDDAKFGAHAEFKTINENKAVYKIPSNTSFKQAAASIEGAHYAMFYIYKIPLPNKAKVFVNGATGAIGSAAVQILKSLGYYVEASSTTKELKTIKSLGADKVFDWQKNDISKSASKCDVYFDSVGKSSFKEARKILKTGGVYMSSELGHNMQNPLLSLINPLQRLFTKRNIKFPLPLTRKKEIEKIAKLLESKNFQPLIDREYPLDNIVDAFEYVETGEKVGNVVIKVS